jgi:serine phosphatase RsbU (regulator of sigma subunit)
LTQPGLKLAEGQLALLDILFGEATVAIGFWDRNYHYVRLNDRLAELAEVPASDHIGRDITEMVPAMANELAADFGRVFATGRALFNRELFDGSRNLYLAATYYPARAVDGQLIGVGAVISDPDEDEEAQICQDKLELALSPEQALLAEIIARAPVGIGLLWGPERRYKLTNAALEQMAPNRGELVGKTLGEAFPEAHPVAEELISEVERTARPLQRHGVVVPFADQHSFRGNRHYNVTLAPVAGPSGAVDGVVAVASETTDQVRRQRTLERDLAEERRLALTLQNSLMPHRLPDIQGAELAASYRPVGQRYEVGGDFYDVFQADEHHWMIAIGDVCGKGPSAAALTALCRYTLRTAAMMGEQSPSNLLQTLNTALLSQVTNQQFATATCAMVANEGTKLTVTLANGGQPRPLLLTRPSSSEEIDVPGMLLGVYPDVELNDIALELNPGSGVLFYTDGLIEAYAPQRVLSTDDLSGIASEAADLDAASAVGFIAQSILGQDTEWRRDDVAYLLLRAREEP